MMGTVTDDAAFDGGRRRRRRTWYRRRIRRRRVILSLTFGLLLAFYGALNLRSIHVQRAEIAKAAAQQNAPGPAQPGVPQNWPVFRYSIVDGGVRSVEDVQRAVANDPVVRHHYANLQTIYLEMSRLQQAIQAYVSYRKDGKVYWTCKPIPIPAGEQVLTDGHNLVRTRCGNQLSKTPQFPTNARFEPPAIEFDFFEITQNGPLMPPVPPLPKDERRLSYNPRYYWTDGPPFGFKRDKKPGPPPYPPFVPPPQKFPLPLVPEPGTWVMIISGISIIGCEMYRMSR
ncbi:MAG: hypothetical protein JO041_13990 [Acidobacteria bacterium]|nr:hypothetical protein [Acidobacteriota bacterium]